MKTILITGCSSGIGYETAKLLKQQGWKVFASCRKQEDVIRLQQEGFESLLLDVNNSEQIHSAFESIQTSGHLDAVFCNAGYGLPSMVEDVSRQDLQAIFETNVFGVWEVMNEALKIFHQQKYGKIIITSSILGFAAMPFRGAYNSTKFAVEGMADTLRLELANTDIFVSLIEPGPIQSNFRSNSKKQFEKLDVSNSVHQKTYKKHIKYFNTKENKNPFALPPSACAEVCLKILNTKKPKARYRVTFPTKLFWILKRILPTSVFDFICRKSAE
ncbi:MULTISPECIES: SDR family NAD(P)-dependent oxidoreductase [Pasteurellaceae]|uniref:SDR family NAD(P)-dependent oxidoreductase n=1 Tax=Pasteurella atlantica TaxID=2827233 RepID=A0AAW8CI69_9PAST|nr:SDR family NAD(P)-dependent oxidoreductase [Pasteurella atlantica]MBR0572701.1 SDR family NAD(P)-dependent oxidoreductase [Pasteurella atlantica]MDP8038646.1 SDR family NAD(P)-dependent oxidoreductase [Pasteurella atlantica]MDP8040738.1 SDR family NAD(P)-dependent oxidoreductase [Pasteurella atlantica]MDP8042873.1 SDR family NAD(P)-dependent oxidoreductase [Pasteurella atlantica]MDP8044960.1 SDR family NAD(P)-dependent oxidoreductase [Pasteurella atlantica]